MRNVFVSVLSLVVCLVQVFAEPVTLEIKAKTIEVNGKSVKMATIEQPDGTWGYHGKIGDKFDVIVKNDLPESTVIHWHGLILPNSQDGMAGVTQVQAIAPDASQHYQFPLVQSGTYWMHSHYGLQLQSGVEAPLILEAPDDKQYQQVVVMFQDFSFKSPESILAGLSNGAISGHNMNDDNSMKMGPAIKAGETVMESEDMENMVGMDDMSDMANMNHDSPMDLNDVKYDAYLTNYHTPLNPQVTQVHAGKLVKLRFINGAAASNFWVNLGKLNGKLVAVDGQSIRSVKDNKFQLAMGQRLDVIVRIPAKGGTFPILGLVEGLKAQTGLILTTRAISVSQTNLIESQATISAPALNYNQELRLHGIGKLRGAPDKITLNLVMTGKMNSYQWELNHQRWPNITPLQVKQGQLVTFVLDNQSMMAHPIHLHGYDFKVISIDGKLINGAFRDTVLVMPHSKVIVQFVANYPGNWMLHCHTAYHMEAGMMTYLVVSESK